MYANELKQKQQNTPQHSASALNDNNYGINNNDNFSRIDNYTYGLSLVHDELDCSRRDGDGNVRRDGDGDGDVRRDGDGNQNQAPDGHAITPMASNSARLGYASDSSQALRLVKDLVKRLEGMMQMVGEVCMYVCMYV
jgi:hypothetical protein